MFIVLVDYESVWVLAILCLLALAAYVTESIGGKGRTGLTIKRPNPYKGSSGGSFIITPVSTSTGSRTKSLQGKRTSLYSVAPQSHPLSLLMSTRLAKKVGVETDYVEKEEVHLSPIAAPALTYVKRYTHTLSCLPLLFFTHCYDL